MPDDSRVAENKGNKACIFCLTENRKKEYLLPVSKLKGKLRIPKKVAFEPSPEERDIIQAAHGKHGLNKATDIIRMALRRFAEAEGFQKAS